MPACSVDPFSKKDWYDIKAPSAFTVRNVGKTLVTRTAGTKVGPVPKRAAERTGIVLGSLPMSCAAASNRHLPVIDITVFVVRRLPRTA